MVPTHGLFQEIGSASEAFGGFGYLSCNLMGATGVLRSGGSNGGQ